MMNKTLNLFMALSAVAITACSSMDVSLSEALEGNYPKDFTVEAYLSVHPELAGLQIQDLIKAHNDSLMLESEAIAADTAAFFADTASLHQIYVNPYFAGYSEELWVEDWTPNVISETVCGLDTTYVTVKPDTLKALKVWLGEITYDAAGKIIRVEGFSDSLKTEPVAFDIDGVLNTIVNRSPSNTGTVVDSTDCKVVETRTEGEIPKDKRRRLVNFNFNDNLLDLVELESLLQNDLNMDVIALQFIMYGQSHGWAYRICTDEEKNNPVQTETYPAVKLYCDDDGIIREIAE